MKALFVRTMEAIARRATARLRGKSRRASMDSPDAVQPVAAMREVIAAPYFDTSLAVRRNGRRLPAPRAANAAQNGLARQLRSRRTPRVDYGSVVCPQLFPTRNDEQSKGTLCLFIRFIRRRPSAGRLRSRASTLWCSSL